MDTTTGRCVVRVAVPEDLVPLLQLHHRHEQPGQPLPEPPTAPQQTTWDRMMATPNLTIYVATMGSNIVGNTCMTVVPGLINGCRPTAFVEPMLVAAAVRRSGIGRLMVDRLIADARAQGVYKVQLLSHKRHATDGAHAFYRSLGFTPEAEGFRLYLEGQERAG